MTNSINLDALLEGLSELSHPLEGAGALRLEPHALHLVQVLHRRDALTREFLAHFLGVGNPVCQEHVLRAPVEGKAKEVSPKIGHVKLRSGLRIVRPSFMRFGCFPSQEEKGVWERG